MLPLTALTSDHRVLRASPTPFLSRPSTLVGYLILLLATIPVMPVVWVPIRQQADRPATLTLSTIVAVGGVWVLLRLVSKRENRSFRRSVLLLGTALVVSAFLWRLDNPIEELHFFQYGFLSYLTYASFAGMWPTLGVWSLRSATLGLAVVIGLVDEGIQYLVPSRVGEIHDVGVNVLAGFLGLIVTELSRDESHASVSRPREATESRWSPRGRTGA